MKQTQLLKFSQNLRHRMRVWFSLHAATKIKTTQEQSVCCLRGDMILRDKLSAAVQFFKNCSFWTWLSQSPWEKENTQVLLTFINTGRIKFTGDIFPKPFAFLMKHITGLKENIRSTGESKAYRKRQKDRGTERKTRRKALPLEFWGEKGEARFNKKSVTIWGKATSTNQLLMCKLKIIIILCWSCKTLSRTESFSSEHTMNQSTFVSQIKQHCNQWSNDAI